MVYAVLTLFLLAASGPVLLLLAGGVLRRERRAGSHLARAVLALGAVSLAATLAWATAVTQALFALRAGLA